MKKIALIALAVAAMAMQASAQSPNQQATAGVLAGTWKGTVGQWSVKLVVNGTKGTLHLGCQSNDFIASVDIKADGTMDQFVKTGSGSRKMRANLSDSSLSIEAAGSCGGGNATLSRQG